jgi:hypothetical protein
MTTQHEDTIAVIDDCPLTRLMWNQTARANKFKIKLFERPEDLLLDLPKIHHQIACVITDQYFDNSETFDGLGLAAALRSNGFSKNIYLSSDYEFPATELSVSTIRMQVSKTATDAWATIQKDLRKCAVGV